MLNAVQGVLEQRVSVLGYSKSKLRMQGPHERGVLSCTISRADPQVL
jgi:hypothetical protein